MLTKLFEDLRTSRGVSAKEAAEWCSSHSSYSREEMQQFIEGLENRPSFALSPLNGNRSKMTVYISSLGYDADVAIPLQEKIQKSFPQFAYTGDQIDTHPKVIKYLGGKRLEERAKKASKRTGNDKAAIVHGTMRYKVLFARMKKLKTADPKAYMITGIEKAVDEAFSSIKKEGRTGF